jgi:hypothetical protein
VARIIVTTDQSEQGAGAVLLEESVEPVHLSTEHAARQLIERLNWALADAAAEPVRVERHVPARTRRRSTRSGQAPRPRRVASVT